MTVSAAPRWDARAEYAAVHALVCEASPMLRQGIRMALNNLGIRQIHEAGSVVNAQRALAEEAYDLLVINAVLDNTDTTCLLRQMRLGALGRDPFAVAVLLLLSPTDADVTRAVNSGADDILLVPFAAEQLRSRVAALGQQRRPFIVTHDYIGPDRRKTPRPGVPSAAQFRVPNPMHARITGSDPARYVNGCRMALDAIAAERIKRLAAHVEWECKAIHGSLSEGQATAEATAASLYRLETVCDELAERLERHLGHATDTVIEILDRCKELRSTPAALTIAHAESLLGVSRRIAGVYAGR